VRPESGWIVKLRLLSRVAASAATCLALAATGAQAATQADPATALAQCSSMPYTSPAQQTCAADLARALSSQASSAFSGGDVATYKTAVSTEARALALAAGTSDDPGPIIAKILGRGSSSTTVPTGATATSKAPGKRTPRNSRERHISNAGSCTVGLAAGETRTGIDNRPTAVGHVAVSGCFIPSGALYVAEWRYSGGWYVDADTTDALCNGIGCLDSVQSHSLHGKYYAYANAVGNYPAGYSPPTYNIVNTSLVVTY
jgi:hypothetical protein